MLVIGVDYEITFLAGLNGILVPPLPLLCQPLVNLTVEAVKISYLDVGKLRQSGALSTV